jgi:hypothetical protein
MHLLFSNFQPDPCFLDFSLLICRRCDKHHLKLSIQLWEFKFSGENIQLNNINIVNFIKSYREIYGFIYSSIFFTLKTFWILHPRNYLICPDHMNTNQMVWQNIGAEEKSSFEEDIPVGMTMPGPRVRLLCAYLGLWWKNWIWMN